MKKDNKNPQEEIPKIEDDKLTDDAVNEIVHQEADQIIESESGDTSDFEQPRGSKAKRFWHWVATHKKITIPLAVVVILAVLAAVPFTRYAIAGLFIKQNFTVEITDSKTGRPVSEATVKLGDQEVFTDNKGRAQIRSSVGNKELKISKIYYEDFSQDVLVPLTSPDIFSVSLVATGRTVPVSVVNSITKLPLAGAHLEALDAKVTTDEQGKALMVVPADQPTAEVSITADGYNTQKATLQVNSEEVPENTFSLTPTGKLYFLSNQSGKVDVVKSNLDGTDRQVVLAGTGNEISEQTVLVASRDWQHLALKSRRDGGEHDKLFAIDTSNDKVSVMDEGGADFQVYGWSDDRFIYKVTRQDVNVWEPKREVLKSFNPSDGHITFLYETTGQGDEYSNRFETINDVAVLLDGIAYTKRELTNKFSIYSVRNDGSSRQTLQESDDFINMRLFKPNELLFGSFDTAPLYSYTGGGNVKTVEGKSADDLYTQNYLNYLVSPDGKKSLWMEYRDGKSVVLVGNSMGDDSKELATFTDHYSAYGWFTDNYLLLSKEGSELLITPSNTPITDESQLLKVSDFFRSPYTIDAPSGYSGL